MTRYELPTLKSIKNLQPPFRPTRIGISDGHCARAQSARSRSFEPVDATDMVSLLTGDVSYVSTLIKCAISRRGLPFCIAYHGGVAYDQESSWVGLGWNLNPGAINRSVMGIQMIGTVEALGIEIIINMK